jgi:hypothetical protein
VGSPHVLVVPLMNLRALDKINQSEKWGCSSKAIGEVPLP